MIPKTASVISKPSRDVVGATLTRWQRSPMQKRPGSHSKVSAQAPPSGTRVGVADGVAVGVRVGVEVGEGLALAVGVTVGVRTA